jgi:hypothetical protein
MLAADCETLPAAPFVNAWEPLVVLVPPPLGDLARPGDYTRCDRGAEDLKVVIIDLVF